MKRRDFIKLSSLLTIAGSAHLLQSCSDSELETANKAKNILKIGYLPITDATPLLVAHAQGIFAKYHVDTEKPILFRSWSQLVEAFISGQVNLVHLLAPITVWMRYSSQFPVKMIMWNHISGSSLTVKPDINTVADLGGKTIAIPYWYSIHNVVLQQILKTAGLKVTEKNPSTNEVHLTIMAPADMVAALAANTISGFIVAEPFSAIAEAKGVGKVLRFTADVWQDHACCITVMKESDLNNKPEWTQNIVNALVEAQIWTNLNREKVAHILSKEGNNQYTPHEHAVLDKVFIPSEQSWKKYEDNGVIHHKGWNQKRIDFQPYPYPSYTEKLIEMLKETYIPGKNDFLQELDTKVAAEELVDLRFITNALKEQDALNYFNIAHNFTRVEHISV